MHQEGASCSADPMLLRWFPTLTSALTEARCPFLHWVERWWKAGIESPLSRLGHFHNSSLKGRIKHKFHYNNPASKIVVMTMKMQNSGKNEKSDNEDVSHLWIEAAYELLNRNQSAPTAQELRACLKEIAETISRLDDLHRELKKWGAPSLPNGGTWQPYVEFQNEAPKRRAELCSRIEDCKRELERKLRYAQRCIRSISEWRLGQNTMSANKKVNRQLQKWNGDLPVSYDRSKRLLTVGEQSEKMPRITAPKKELYLELLVNDYNMRESNGVTSLGFKVKLEREKCEWTERAAVTARTELAKEIREVFCMTGFIVRDPNNSFRIPKKE